MGDVNHGNIKWDTQQNTGVEDQQFMFLVQDNLLTQHVLEPTIAARVFDIVLSSQKDCVDNFNRIVPHTGIWYVCRVKLSILDPLSRKWHSTVIEHIVKMQILLITRYGSRYICLASKLQELYYFSRKIIKCKTNMLSNLGHCLPILDLRGSYIGPHLFQTKTTLNIVVLN